MLKQITDLVDIFVEPEGDNDARAEWSHTLRDVQGKKQLVKEINGALASEDESLKLAVAKSVYGVLKNIRSIRAELDDPVITGQTTTCERMERILAHVNMGTTLEPQVRAAIEDILHVQLPRSQKTSKKKK